MKWKDECFWIHTAAKKTFERGDSTTLEDAKLLWLLLTLQLAWLHLIIVSSRRTTGRNWQGSTKRCGPDRFQPQADIAQGGWYVKTSLPFTRKPHFHFFLMRALHVEQEQVHMSTICWSQLRHVDEYLLVSSKILHHVYLFLPVTCQFSRTGKFQLEDKTPIILGSVRW